VPLEEEEEMEAFTSAGAQQRSLPLARSEFREACFGTPAGNPVLRDSHFPGRRKSKQGLGLRESKTTTTHFADFCWL